MKVHLEGYRDHGPQGHLYSQAWCHSVAFYGKRAPAPFDPIIVQIETWITLPRAAQCGKCKSARRRHDAIGRQASDEQILAVEAALHGIARAFRAPLTTSTRSKG